MRGLRHVLVTGILLVAALSGTATAGQRTGGTIVVEEGEVLQGLTATGGKVVVRGTVEGDLRAVAGSVVIARNGTVTGRLRAYGGKVRIAGTVKGNAVASGGTVIVEETGRIGGSLGAGAPTVTIAGTVGDDATVGAASITLEQSAVVRGDLVYNGGLTDEGATVEGQVRQSSDLNLLPVLPLFGPLFALYWVLATLLLGAILLAAFPDFAETVTTEIPADPLRIGAVGLLILVAVPVILTVLALTVLGLPLALVGFVGYLAALWIGDTYARYAIGRLLLSYRDIEHRGAALLVGVVLVAILIRLPVVGFWIRILVILPGLGVLALGLRSVYRTVTTDPHWR